MKKIFLNNFCAVLLGFALTACSTTEKLSDNLPVGYITLETLTPHVANLVSNQMLPNDDTISIMLTECQDVKEKSLLNDVGDSLIKKGYAVERVSPKDDRQEGDINEMTASGVKLSLSLIPLLETNYYKLSVKLNGIFYYRMYIMQNQELTPVSAWSMQSI